MLKEMIILERFLEGYKLCIDDARHYDMEVLGYLSVGFIILGALIVRRERKLYIERMEHIK